MIVPTENNEMMLSVAELIVLVAGPDAELDHRTDRVVEVIHNQDAGLCHLVYVDLDAGLLM